MNEKCMLTQTEFFLLFTLNVFFHYLYLAMSNFVLWKSDLGTILIKLLECIISIQHPR